MAHNRHSNVLSIHVVKYSCTGQPLLRHHYLDCRSFTVGNGGRLCRHGSILCCISTLGCVCSVIHNKQSYGGYLGQQMSLKQDVVSSCVCGRIRGWGRCHVDGCNQHPHHHHCPVSQSPPTAHVSDSKYYWRTDRPRAVTHRVKSLISCMMGPLHPKVRM